MLLLVKLLLELRETEIWICTFGEIFSNEDSSHIFIKIIFDFVDWLVDDRLPWFVKEDISVAGIVEDWTVASKGDDELDNVDILER